MSPLEIHLLLNLHHSPVPAAEYPSPQRYAPAMKDAFERFEQAGLLRPGQNFHTVMIHQTYSENFLTDKGLALVNQLCEVQL